jgi:hypothetical protein
VQLRTVLGEDCLDDRGVGKVLAIVDSRVGFVELKVDGDVKVLAVKLDFSVISVADEFIERVHYALLVTLFVGIAFDE